MRDVCTHDLPRGMRQLELRTFPLINLSTCHSRAFPFTRVMKKGKRLEPLWMSGKIVTDQSKLGVAIIGTLFTYSLITPPYQIRKL